MSPAIYTRPFSGIETAIRKAGPDSEFVRGVQAMLSQLARCDTDDDAKHVEAILELKDQLQKVLDDVYFNARD